MTGKCVQLALQGLIKMTSEVEGQRDSIKDVHLDYLSNTTSYISNIFFSTFHTVVNRALYSFPPDKGKAPEIPHQTNFNMTSLFLFSHPHDMLEEAFHFWIISAKSLSQSLGSYSNIKCISSLNAEKHSIHLCLSDFRLISQT